MALKFLNKKGWHTGSLRNIETVWKAEQKHEGEQKKLEELRKQIQDEREKSEFRLMQEQAGLVPKQERLEFLYDSGLQVGKVAQADEYLLGKPVEEAPQPESDVGQVAAKPGALFVEEKPASANDSWRKLHSDPLFLIRQQEQAAIAKIKSNPVKMAEIKKAAEMKKKLKEEKKKKSKEAKRERREKKKRKKLRSSSSEDSSDSDNPRKSRKHGHESNADDDSGHKDRKTRVSSRNLSRSPSRSSIRSPVREDRLQSPRKSRGDELDSRNIFKGQEHKTSDLRLKGSDARDFEKRKRVPSRSPSRSPVRRDHDGGRWRRDDLDSRGGSKREGRQWEHNGSDVRSKEFEIRDSEKRRRAQSRSPSRSPVRRDHGRNMPRRGDARSLSRSPSRSPSRRDHGRSMPRRGDARSASQGEGSKRELTTSDRMLKRPEERVIDKGKRILPRSPSKSLSRSPIRRSSVRRTSASRSPRRKSPVPRDRDQQLKGSEDRSYDKRKRVPSRSPSVSRSRSPIRRGPIRRSPVRRDHDESKSRGNYLESRGAFKGEGRELVQNGGDHRIKVPEDRDYERRKRAPSRSLSRSLSRSPVRRRDYGQSRSRRDDLDYRGAPRSEGRHRDRNFSDQRLKESDYQDSRPQDTREQERRPNSSTNGSADDLRSNDPVVREEKLVAEEDIAGRKDTNGNTGGPPPRPMNRGRPPKPGQLSDAERAARLAEMQANADVHEEQRWQRLKRAADADAVEVKRSEKDKTNEEFLADTQKSIFGSERASASTIEKSVKRRAHFIERSSADNERNAFRR
ncbi:hypothetical protein KC19_1G047500 [Ceratodon purpureus]|uniref:CBF1-interacting co-repressor CIR N-terminal domain-containing protein n=1 Tax=Ceratodon purpureus TaxID=3225 RepID=A0A8T0J2M0_CERPU|nr:hypothetical protein KC19_1G047500 [Ceratodon purpureus]KAG0589777.1 hypothetical protein KC19_1G047500 [Ceratodon purpureus]